jgi:hypothetical protein
VLFGVFSMFLRLDLHNETHVVALANLNSNICKKNRIEKKIIVSPLI